MSKIREQQIRERVRAARALVRLSRQEGLGIPAGEVEWAQMYLEDVEPLRRNLTEMVIADAARALTDRVQKFAPLLEARTRAQRFLGSRPK